MNFDEQKQNLSVEENLMKEQNSDLYQGLIEQNQTLVDSQNAYLDEWQQTQDKINQDNLSFTQQQIEQNKQEAVEDQNEELKASQESYQKFINPYGVEAEQQATTGLANQGYSESAKAMAYNTSQTRISNAKNTTNKIIADYNNEFTKAKLEYDALGAENALTVLKGKLENNLSAFEYSSNMTIQQQQQENTIDDKYYARLQDILSQEQAEKDRQEAIRQWEQEFAYQKEQDRIAQENWQKEYNLSLKARTSGGSSSRSSGGSSSYGGFSAGGSSSSGNVFSVGMSGASVNYAPGVTGIAQKAIGATLKSNGEAMTYDANGSNKTVPVYTNPGGSKYYYNESTKKWTAI